MGTYHNAYDILYDMREGLNEFSTALVQGTDTSGKFSNTFLVNKMNRAQRVIYARLIKTLPEQFLTDADVTVSSGVITLPWDFGMLRRLEDEDGLKVYPVDVDKRPRSGGQGSDRLYRRQGNTLVLTDLSVSETYHLWYWRKPRELDVGAATGTGVLAASAKGIDDYYNGMILENITGASFAAITDYAGSTRTATGPTLTNGQYYGIVSDLPEMFHHLIAPLGIILSKAQHPTSPEKPTRAEMELFRTEVDEAISAFGHKQDDVDIEDIFTDFGVTPPYEGINIPGQGYTIF